MAKTRIQDYRYDGFGFPLIVENCPMMRVFDEWVPKLDFVALQCAMAIRVALKEFRLTGTEVKFLRLHLEMSLQDVAKRLGVTRRSVSDWEECDQALTKMEWTAEKEIRLYALNATGTEAKQHQIAYGKLTPKPRRRARRHVLNSTDIKNRKRFVQARLEALNV